TLRGVETGGPTNGQGERLRPLLPSRQPRTGRPANGNGTAIDGTVRVLRTGCSCAVSPSATVPG
ncbi:MAG: hypothetical protein AVDCRST_MAG59-1005, partial [uncultured Thermomicrobiales bacterium]